MEPLAKLSASGGNDVYGAGTYKFFDSDVSTVTLTGTVGTATITCHGLAKVATYATSLTVTAANFASVNYDAYKAIGITLTNSGETVIFTSTGLTRNGVTSIVNLTTDLAGTVVVTKTGGQDTATFTLSATGTNKGMVTVNGLSKSFAWDTNVGTTSAAFVAANAAAYLAIGIVLTGTVTLIFTAAVGVPITDATFSTLSGDAAATIVRTSTKLPHPIYGLNIITDAVITSYKHYPRGTGSGIYKTNSYVQPGYKLVLGTTITVGSAVTVFEWPVVEIVIASGTVTFDFVK
jgi:hypothetical protein